MFIDDKLIMADSSTLASISASSTSIIGDVLNLGLGTGGFGSDRTLDIGEGGDVEFRCICEDEAFTSNGSPSVEISLVTAANEGLSSSSATLLSVTGIAKASGTDGAVLLQGWVPRGTVKQYVGTKVKAGTAALTAGKITSWLGRNIDSTVTQKKA